MKYVVEKSRWALAAAVGVLVLGLTGVATSAQAAAFDGYRLAGAIVLPDASGPYDALPDGRLIALAGADVYVETGVASRVFSSLGTLGGADIASFGAAFIRISPDGTKIAVGNNGGSTFSDFKIGVLDLGTLTGTWFTANHFDARWIDGTQLAVAASDYTNGSSVTVLDTTSVDPANPTNPAIVSNIGGASGGIAFDASGRLFVGNGYTSIGPSGTGAVKVFEQAAWSAALSGGTSIDFEAEGVLVVDVLGASPLGFDNEGNLYVGGADAAPDDDSVALVNALAIANALAGGGAVDAGNPVQVRRFDPLPANDFNFYSAGYNPVTGELFVRDYAAATLYVYRDLQNVPTVSQWGLATMSLLTLTVGTLAIRTRRSTLAWGVAG